MENQLKWVGQNQPRRSVNGTRKLIKQETSWSNDLKQYEKYIVINKTLLGSIGERGVGIYLFISHL